MTQDSPQQQPFGAYPPSAFEQRLIGIAQRCNSSWLGKRLAFALRKLAQRTASATPRDVNVFGAKMRLAPFDNVAEKRLLYTPQYFDALEREILAQDIEQNNQNYVFIDIGANVGGYTLFVAMRAGKSAKIIALEPQPEMFERLTFNIRQNPTGTIKALDCAVADRDGEMTLFLAPKNRGEASLKMLSADPAQGHAVQVQARALLSIVQSEGLEHINALKIDIEGAEDIVLLPFFESAPESVWPKLIILEDGTGRWGSDLVETLKQKGYSIAAKTRLNFVLKR